MSKKPKDYDGPPIMLGSYGPYRLEGKAIQEFERPPGSQHGPYIVDAVPGPSGKVSIMKISRDPTPCNRHVCDGMHGEFVRYADKEQVAEMYEALVSGNEALFLELVNSTNARVNGGKKWWRADGQPDQGWGGMDEVCKWIEDHDKVFVSYQGSDEAWPDGCWAIESANADRQFVDLKQLVYVACKILKMPVGPAQKRRPPNELGSWDRAYEAQLSVEDAFADEDPAEEISLSVEDAFAEDPSDEEQGFISRKVAHALFGYDFTPGTPEHAAEKARRQKMDDDADAAKAEETWLEGWSRVIRTTPKWVNISHNMVVPAEQELSVEDAFAVEEDETQLSVEDAFL
jgi:hypothetical protein